MMSSRVVGYSERNVDIDAPNIVVANANTATLVLPNEYGRGEIAQRTIQNVGANRAYYSWGMYEKTGAGGTVTSPVCDNLTLFHGYMEPGQQLDCSIHRHCVSVFSVGGTSISTTVVRRTDMTHRN